MNVNSPKGEALPPGHPLLRAEHNAFTANLARLRIKAWSWFAANPGVFFILAAANLGGAAVVCFKPLIGVSLTCAGMIAGFFSIRAARKKYLGGGICPGVILSADEGLVAVFTDLKLSGGVFHPAIKIVRQPLHRFTADEVYDGMRVATVATFHGNARKLAWKDFSPEVIGCVVQNDDLVTRSFESITEDQWQGMEVYLARMAQKTPGLYRFWSGVEDESSMSSSTSGGGLFSSSGVLKTVLGVAVGFTVIYFLLTTSASKFNEWRHNDSTAAQIMTEESNGSPDAERGTKPTEVSKPSDTGNVSTKPQPRPSPAGGLPANFAVGQQVQARWDGRWIKATVLEKVRGGIMLRVKLDDPKCPHPVVVVADQVRPQ